MLAIRVDELELTAAGISSYDFVGIILQSDCILVCDDELLMLVITMLGEEDWTTH